MASDCEEKKVYEIPGEPAIVIDGVPPIMDHLDDPQVVASKADSEVLCPGFGKWMEGRAVRKLFDEQFYNGTVTKFDGNRRWYRVVYEDGDFEDLEWHELEEILVPLDITVPLKTLALKRVKKNEMQVHKTTENQLGSRGGKAAIKAKHGRTNH